MDDYDSGTWRGVYTVKFSNSVYVLHVFQKKSRKGIRTPQSDIDLIRKNLKIAEADSRAEIKSKETPDGRVP